jgi:cell division protein FtsN
MADQNLHDIKIDELDSPKKTSLKNILTLVALLFIIFAISVVITQLILNTEDNKELLDSNSSKEALLNNETATDSSASDESEKSELNSSTIPTLSPTIKERNITSSIRTPLITNEPTKLTTYDTPKKPAEVEPEPVVKKKPEPKVTKEYIEDRVIVRKNPPKPVEPEAPTLKKSYLGGEEMAVSNSYYIKVGTYRDTSKVIQKIKQNNFNYSLVKVENDTTLTRVFIGPFFSRNQAGTELDKVKENILAGAYITKKAK